MGKFKNSLISFQKEVSSVTDEINLEDKDTHTDKKNNKDNKKNG